MKLTNIFLDDKLIQDCMQAAGLNNHQVLLAHALKELLRHESQTKILELKGKICWQGDLDEWRKGRTL
jgi:Arc/MetJ family transcription regulator